VEAEHIIEYAARTIDDEWEFRATCPGELYSAAQWARDHQALGSRVLRRRIIVIDDWAEMPSAGEAWPQTGQ
jgi:hypothetical protein